MTATLRNALATLAATAALGATAQSTGNFVDTANFRVDPNVVLAVGGPSQQRLAQTLTVGWGGYSAGVFLPIRCASGTLTVELRDVVGDAPGGVLHTSASVPATDLDVQPGRFVYVDLPAKTPFYFGTRLALVVSNATGSCGFNHGRVKSGYSGGRGLYEALPNPPGWVPFSAFGGTADDLPFQFIVRHF